MGRKKDGTLGILALQPGFAGFSDEDVKQIGDVLGREISRELRNELEGEISGWLIRFAAYRSYGYGVKERRLVGSAQRAAADLYSCLQELGELADAGLDGFTYAQGMTNDQFMAVLASLDQFKSSVDESVDKGAIDVGAIQINSLRDVLLGHRVRVTVTVNNYVTTFNPSAFTKLVDCLWSIEPRLRVFQPRAADYWGSLSQWIGHQLRKPDALKPVEKLVLMRRHKLKSRPKHG